MGEAEEQGGWKGRKGWRRDDKRRRGGTRELFSDQQEISVLTHQKILGDLFSIIETR